MNEINKTLLKESLSSFPLSLPARNESMQAARQEGHGYGIIKVSVPLASLTVFRLVPVRQT